MDDGRRWALEVLGGEDRGIGAMALRGLLSVAEPVYSAIMRVRNSAYCRRILKSHALPRPTVSVGNLTTGGTGKTPVVRWLAEQLIARGLRPAILLRGYRGETSGESDEQRMLAEALGGHANVIANPDRRAGGMSAMREMPQPDVFVLDDGFQHRRVAREFDLVLIDATEPFGFGHVLPRGLLREPMRGLARAHAVLVTRLDQVTTQQMQMIEAQVRRFCPAGMIYFARHVHTGLRSSDGADIDIAELSRRRFFAFAGIANPQALRQQLDSFGRCVGFSAFADHHAYTADDLAAIRQDAAAAGAEVLVTTEKDWVKLRNLPAARAGLSILRLDLRIEFRDGDDGRLLNQILMRIQSGDGFKPAASRGWL